MAMYGMTDRVRAGVLDGLDHDFVSKRVAVACKFGAPLMVNAGNEKDAELADSTDTGQKFIGVAVEVEQEDRTVVGEWPAKSVVSVCIDGVVSVRVPDGKTAIANKPAYVVDLLADGDYQKFTDVSGANTYDTAVGVFASNAWTLGTGETFAFVRLTAGLK